MVATLPSSPSTPAAPNALGATPARVGGGNVLEQELIYTGSNNVVFGVNVVDHAPHALERLTTGTQSTPVVVSTLDGCTTGTQNTAVGDSTLDGCTTGTQNTAVGDSTGASAPFLAHNPGVPERVTTGTPCFSYSPAVQAMLCALTDGLKELSQNTAGASAPCFSYSPAVQAMLCALTDGLKELLAALEHQSIDEQCQKAVACTQSDTPWKVTREVVEHNNYQVLQVAARGHMQCLTAIHQALTITPQMARSAKMLQAATSVGRLDVVRFLIETVGLGVEDVCAPDVLAAAVTSHDILVYLLRTVQCSEDALEYVLKNTPNPAGLVARLAKPQLG
jgi:hypothetical protein